MSGAGAVGSPVIRPISKGVVHRICAGQVILDLSSAVKELVENSLDAGATSIEIALKEYGLESFQVIDNGCGISPQNFKVLALKHHTSKLVEFPDLQSLTTFGFRGEALSSLCALGELTVETRTMNDVVATHLTYDPSGLLVAERKTARQVGTTVTLKKLFWNLPVRCKEFRRNIRKEYGKLISLLNAYALISKGVRLICTNNTGKNVRSVVLKTPGSGSLKENITTVFGTNTFSCLEPIKLDISDSCVVEGFISKSGNGSGRNIGDRQFFFVNGRPVDMPKIGKLVNELYRGANSKQYPIAIMNFSIPTRAYDVNITPDKRKIFFSDESSMLQSLREALEKIYSSDQAAYSIKRTDELNQDKCAPRIQSMHDISDLPSRQLFPENDIDEKVHNEKNYEDDDIAVTTCQNDDTKFSDEQVTDRVGACSMIEGFALKVEGNQKNKSPLVSVEYHRGFAAAKIEKQVPLQSHLIEKINSSNITSLEHSRTVQMSLNKFVTINKRKYGSVETALSEVPLLRSGPTTCMLRGNSSREKTAAPNSPNKCEDDDSDKTKWMVSRPTKKPTTNNASDEAGTNVLLRCASKIQLASTDDKDYGVLFGSVHNMHSDAGEEQKIEKRASLDTDLLQTAAVGPSNQSLSSDLLDAPSGLESSGVSTNSPVASSSSKVGFTLQFSVSDLISKRKQRMSKLKCISQTSGGMNLNRVFAASSLELSQLIDEEGKPKALAAATNELERMFKKEDFNKMKVIGQFNLGFIIGKLDHDLFIVDQHAADEKFNFERLSQSTILNQQPLLRPLTLELSPEEEIVISMHMETIRRNGFLLEEDMHAPSGHRYKLKAVPFSKNITFGVSDIKELISIVSDSHGECSMVGSYLSDSVDSVCPPKIRAMLASRACRSSVMIGDSLGRNEMKKILEHLATLKSPWNCPHGRPTMRHLVDLRTAHRTHDEEETMA